MNAIVIISIGASVASILSLGYAVVIRKVDDAVVLLKVILLEQAEVEILSLIEQTVSDQVEEKTRIQAEQEAKGRLDEKSMTQIVTNVYAWVEFEYSPTIEDNIWKNIEASLPSRIENCITKERAERGLMLATKRVRVQVMQVALARIKRLERPIVENKVRAEISNGVSKGIADKLKVEIEKILIDPPPPRVPPDPAAAKSVEYIHDDKGYRDWVQSHPQGFIINTYQPGTDQSQCMILHQAKCGSVTNLENASLVPSHAMLT